MRRYLSATDGLRRGAGCKGSRALSLLEPFWGRLGKHLEWERQGQTVALDKQAMSSPFAWLVFSVLVLGKGWEFLSLKAQDEQLTPTSGLGSYHPSPTHTNTKITLWGQSPQRLFLWTCYQPADKDKLPHRTVRFGTGAPCSEPGHCCVQQRAAGVCTRIATHQSNDPSSLFISRNQRDDSAAQELEALHLFWYLGLSKTWEEPPPQHSADLPRCKTHWYLYPSIDCPTAKRKTQRQGDNEIRVIFKLIFSISFLFGHTSFLDNELA